MRLRFRRRQPIPALQVDKSAVTHEEPLDASEAIAVPESELGLGPLGGAELGRA